LRNRLNHDSLLVHRAGCGHRVRAGALPRATREPCRPLSVAEAGRPPGTCLEACGHHRLFAPCPALWHPLPAGEIVCQGHTVGRHALRSWLRRRGLRALSTRPQCPRTTVADSTAVVAENLLLGQPVSTGTQCRGNYLSALSRRALVLSVHLTRYLLAAHGRLVPQYAHTHRVGAHCPGVSANATPASS